MSWPAATSDADLPLEDLVARLRAPGGYEEFAKAVRAARCCRRPVRLVGRVTVPGDEGARRVVFSSRELPDGVLLKGCGTRRETLCPPCASLYRGDAFQLVVSGLRGGKGIPQEVSSHPVVMITLTAPSFGPVHRLGSGGKCHPTGGRCPHGRLLVCAKRHGAEDEVLGEPLCPDCYDYEGAVLFNACVSELWRRTGIYALRALGQLAGMSVRQSVKCLRLSYVKVVEFQRRGSVHIHALVRADTRGYEQGAAPLIDGPTLATALRIAAQKVSAPAPGRSEQRLSWGRELETVVVADENAGRARAAAYAAKYSTKGSDGSGALDHRLRVGVPPHLPENVGRLVTTAWELGANPEYSNLRLRLWAHTFGYRGHFLTKSRRYSTTFGALRSERQRFHIDALCAAGQEVLDPEEDEITGVVREWSFAGNGYLTAGDAHLAESLAASERDARRSGFEQHKEELCVSPARDASTHFLEAKAPPGGAAGAAD